MTTDRLSVVFFALLGVVALATFQDYGITWDEPASHEYGTRAWKFILSGFSDRSLFEPDNRMLYGGVFEMAAVVATHLSPFGDYETRHFLTMLVGLASIFGCFKLGRLLGGPVAGLLAAITLALAPSYYGHIFNNPRDIPFACGYIWGIYYLVRAYAEAPNITTATLLKFGAVTGLTIGVRIEGWLLWSLLAASLGLKHLMEGGVSRDRKNTFRLGVRSLLVTAGVAFAASIVFWPHLLVNVLRGTSEALEMSSRLVWSGSVLFGGDVVRSGSLPWDYVPRYLLITLPEVIPAAVVVGLVIGLGWLKRLAGRARARAIGSGIVVAAAVLAPILYVIVMGSAMYNGVRHFLFVIPPLAAAAGVALAWFLRLASDVGPWVWRLSLAALAIYAGGQVATMYQLHPHEMVYYNRFVGGVAGAFNRYEMDYMANSYADLARVFSRKLTGEAAMGEAATAEKVLRRRWRVNICPPVMSAAYYLPETFSVVGSRIGADFCMTVVGSSCPISKRNVYAVVQRFGVPLAVVIDLRPPSEGKL